MMPLTHEADVTEGFLSQPVLHVDSAKVRLPPPIYVIVPALNEEKSIGEVIQGIQQALRGFEYEIVMVDGSSIDESAQIAESLGATVLTEKSHGYGGAYLTGFGYVLAKCKNFIAVMIDADSTYAPDDIPALLEPILEGKADMTIANRFANMEPGAMSLRNRIGNKIISRTVSRLYGLKIHDSQSGFRAISPTCLRGMYLEANGMPLATEMLIEARKIKARVAEVPSRYRRRAGESKIRPLHDGYSILWTALRLCSELNPFIIYGTLGAFFLFLGACFGAYSFIGWYEWQFSGMPTWPRLGSALLSVLFFVGGTVVFSLGILLDTLLHHLKSAAYREKFTFSGR
ncbi:MAG: glycosyltransferase family 2 protein [Candidatus Bathyarchaeia archaeon]